MYIINNDNDYRYQKVHLQLICCGNTAGGIMEAVRVFRFSVNVGKESSMRYSRQREAVKDLLSKHYDHPTADAIFAELRETEPNISLATVYRNLNLLASMGEIKKLTFAEGADHFDAVTEPHYHFICQKCGGVSDVPMQVAEHLNEEAAKYIPGILDGHELVFYGICEHCRQAE